LGFTSLWFGERQFPGSYSDQFTDPIPILELIPDKVTHFGAGISRGFDNISDKCLPTGSGFDIKAVIADQSDDFLVAINCVLPKHFPVSDFTGVCHLVNYEINKIPI